MNRNQWVVEPWSRAVRKSGHLPEFCTTLLVAWIGIKIGKFSCFSKRINGLICSRDGGAISFSYCAQTITGDTESKASSSVGTKTIGDARSVGASSDTLTLRICSITSFFNCLCLWPALHGVAWIGGASDGLKVNAMLCQWNSFKVFFRNRRVSTHHFHKTHLPFRVLFFELDLLGPIHSLFWGTFPCNA